VNLEFNQGLHDLKAPDYALTIGQFLMVPGGSKPYIPRVVNAYSGPIPATAARGTGNFGWPVSGRITQKFWTRHPGIDIGAPKGTPVYAADSGYVVTAGWDQERVSYGFMILINHGNGFITRYAHLSAFNVEVGDSVKKGQIIGRVGSTGNSTGPHLHFEIIKNGDRRNPFGYLPGG
jgi:murein DD-endopeptidase MepM/ murein hydrolase activator NlpD